MVCNRKINQYESTDEIDVPANFWYLIEDKSSTSISSTLREKQFRSKRKIIFNLKKDYNKEEVREE